MGRVWMVRIGLIGSSLLLVWLLLGEGPNRQPAHNASSLSGPRSAAGLRDQPPVELSPNPSYRGKPTRYWVQRARHGTLELRGWGSSLYITNEPPLWLPGPSWPQLVCGLVVLRCGWEEYTRIDHQDEDVVPLLLALLQDDDPLARELAARSLALYGREERWDSAVLPALLRASQDEYEMVARSAGWALLRFGPRLEPGLKQKIEAMLQSEELPQPLAGRFSLTAQYLEQLGQRKDLPDWLEHLGSLTAARSAVAQSKLAYLARLPKLERLDLSGTDLTDAGLGFLRGLTHLVRLDVSDTKVTDAGLVALQELPALRKLTVTGTAVTPAGVSQLRRARPDLEVIP